MTIKSLVTSFLRNKRGNTAILFALSLVPLIGAAGGAMDMMRMYSFKTKVQAAADAAALAGASAVGKTEEERRQLVLDAFQSNLHVPGVRLKETPAVNISADKVTVDAMLEARTTFLRFAGLNSLDIGVHSVARRKVGNLELVLVLDNTKSMAGSKLTTLKTAASDLVDNIYNYAEGGNIKTAIVPYSIYVNVGKDKRGEFWLDAPEDEDIYHPASGQCWNYKKTNCRMEICWRWSDGLSMSYSCERCDWVKDTPRPCNGWTQSIRWHGCVGSRPYPLNTLDESYSTSKVPGKANVLCQRPITPLTTDKNVLANEISRLSADVNGTYIPGGLAWGWRVLSHVEPFTEGANPAVNKISKAMVLMTDGKNTCDPNYSNGKHSCGSGKGSVADTLTAELCTNIKAAGIHIYTVAFAVNDNATRDMLKSCASNAASYFDASDNAALLAAFQDISRALGKVFLSE